MFEIKLIRIRFYIKNISLKSDIQGFEILGPKVIMKK